MAVFCLKNLEPLTRVGERLQKTRLEQNLSLEDIFKKTRIPLKYLSAIESGRFQELPQTKAHRLAYMRGYAEALDLNPASFLYQFSQESETECHPRLPSGHLAKPWLFSSLSNIFKKITIAVLLASFLGYLVWQVNGILQPPKLTVFTPMDGYVSNHLTTLVQGETEKEIKLTINGKEIRPNDLGRFEISLDLSNGVNTITISAIKKHGKTTTITRHVMVKSNSLSAGNAELNF